MSIFFDFSSKMSHGGVRTWYRGNSGPITVALKKATRAADRRQSYLASYIATDTIGLGLYSQQE